MFPGRQYSCILRNCTSSVAFSSTWFEIGSLKQVHSSRSAVENRDFLFRLAETQGHRRCLVRPHADVDLSRHTSANGHACRESWAATLGRSCLPSTNATSFRSRVVVHLGSPSQRSAYPRQLLTKRSRVACFRRVQYFLNQLRVAS